MKCLKSVIFDSEDEIIIMDLKQTIYILICETGDIIVYSFNAISSNLTKGWFQNFNPNITWINVNLQ